MKNCDGCEKSPAACAVCECGGGASDTGTCRMNYEIVQKVDADVPEGGLAPALWDGAENFELMPG